MQFSQRFKIADRLSALFGISREASVTPLQEMEALAELLDSGGFDALEEDSRRNKVCRIGVLGRHAAHAPQAMKMLAGLLSDSDVIVRWDAACCVAEIAQKHPILQSDAFSLLDRVRRSDSDPELRTMATCFLEQIREHRDRQGNIPRLYLK